jgi:hypothetical protein
MAKEFRSGRLGWDLLHPLRSVDSPPDELCRREIKDQPVEPQLQSGHDAEIFLLANIDEFPWAVIFRGARGNGTGA